jgi:hypothetical protein
MKPEIIKQYFHNDIMYLIRKEIDWLKSGMAEGVDQDLVEFKRLEQHNTPFFCALHSMITDRVSEYLGVKVKPSYCFTSMYYTGEGVCPPHTDREQCKYTVDLCVNQNETWGIFVDGEEYHLEKGDALIYSGTDHLHYREKIQPTNFCDLVFFHFVPVDFEGPLL